MAYIIECSTEKLFLITSGLFSLDIVPKIHSLSQIEYIYIFCCNENKYQQLTKNYNKIHGIFINTNNLINKLKKDIIQSTRNENFIENSIRNSSDDQPSIIQFDILVDTLVRMSDEADNKATKDMIEQCRSYYSNNQNQLDIIDQFEKEYQFDQAIKWYMRDAFVYRLLNRAFRTENIDIIYIFRFFVKNLYHPCKQNSCLIVGNYSELDIRNKEVTMVNTNEQDLMFHITYTAIQYTHREEIIQRQLQNYGLADALARDVLKLLDQIETLI
ncbi:unnamed protein product [Rotaria sp. Silwood1]|nr:unnamed protein product [Rotaria sp. Silwood1]CAF4731801.1 unnamed protein product [Rotaria sp. Silwood1]